MLEVARAMVERALVELERGLDLVVELWVASGLQLFNLSTGGIPAGKSAERFLKYKEITITITITIGISITITIARIPVDGAVLSCWVKSGAKTRTRTTTRRR